MTTTTTIQPSPQQQAIRNWVSTGKGSSLVDARAGSGKTTTLLQICEEIQPTLTGQWDSVAIIAYNTKIAQELQARLAAKGFDKRRFEARTFHSFGFSAWRKAAPSVKTDEHKVRDLFRSLYTSFHHERFEPFVLAAVSLAKQRLVGVTTSVDDESAWHQIVNHYDLDELLTQDGLSFDPELVHQGLVYAKVILQASIAADQKVIDFDDMIYAPLVHNAKVWTHKWVLVDEAQDTNPARRRLAAKMLRTGGRSVWVGDRYQAIYGFTGADNDALDVVSKEFGCTYLPLTTCYRCASSIVEHAQQWVADLQAAPAAQEGSVEYLNEAGMLDKLTHENHMGSAVLCRNTAPLVDLAFRLIKQQIPCHVEGKDIGAGLLALATKWKAVKTIGALRKRLGDYAAKQTARMMAKGQEMAAASLQDRVDTLFVLMQDLAEDASVGEIQLIVVDMFGDTKEGETPKNLTLSTVHKSKGREWTTVFVLGRNRYQPSPFARQQWQLAQETNLMYVAATRAMRHLYEVVVAPKGA